MSECCYIEDLSGILAQINEARVKAKEKKILARNWSSSLSGLTSNDVKQHWITTMLRREGDKCIPRLNALILLSAINELTVRYKLSKVKEDVLVCKKK